ncbi:MAG: uncharacterized coiled-coil DUF342 family protein [Candidatus Nanohaloarchaea archaeon]|jgi:uncharacterized coiled-coil DUF342 family protein
MAVNQVIENYRETFEELEEVEQEIKSYQEFLGSVQTSFDECRDGCRDRFNGGRVLDADYIKSRHIELVDDDEFIDSVLEGDITSREIREITGYCRGRIAEMREERQEMIDERRQLEKSIGFYRHPKKDFEEFGAGGI